jgi:CRP-like cAMP-binding protein
VKDTSVLVWDRPTIRTLAARYPRILENALWTASDYIDWLLAAHVALSCHTAPQRLAGVLVSLAALLGRAVPGGVELDVTNEDLACAAHITPFTASRLLNEWQRHRAVIKRRGKVVLLAPEQLVTLTA